MAGEAGGGAPGELVEVGQYLSPWHHGTNGEIRRRWVVKIYALSEWNWYEIEYEITGSHEIDEKRVHGVPSVAQTCMWFGTMWLLLYAHDNQRKI